MDIDTIYNPFLKTSSINPEAQEIVKKYTDIDGLNNVMADTYQIAVLNIIGALKDIKISNKNKEYNELLALATYIVRGNTAANGKSYKIQYTEEAQQDFITLACYAAESKCKELVNIVNKALDDAFDLAMYTHKEVILK